MILRKSCARNIAMHILFPEGTCPVPPFVYICTNKTLTDGVRQAVATHKVPFGHFLRLASLYPLTMMRWLGCEHVTVVYLTRCCVIAPLCLEPCSFSLVWQKLSSLLLPLLLITLWMSYQSWRIFNPEKNKYLWIIYVNVYCDYTCWNAIYEVPVSETTYPVIIMTR